VTQDGTLSLIAAALSASAALGSLSACATIVRGSSQAVTATTQPPGAVCEFRRARQPTVIANPTPQTVMLEKSKDDVTIVCRKDGYLDASSQLGSKFEGWTFGNIIFGGLVGVAVDAGSGAMHDYPQSVTLVLIPREFASSGERDQFFGERRAEIVRQSEEVAQQIQKRCQNQPDCASQIKRLERARDKQLAELDQQVALVRVKGE
jgi:hypothetical protein